MYLHSTRTNEIPARAQLHTSVDHQTAPRMQNGSICTQNSSRTFHGCEQSALRLAVYTQSGTARYAERQGRERQSARAQQTEAGEVIFRAMWE
jgi:hypothetical protein